MADPRQFRSKTEETEVLTPRGGVFLRRNSLFVSEGEKSPNGRLLRKEKEVVPSFSLEREARRRPHPRTWGVALGTFALKVGGVVVYQRRYFPLDNSTVP